MIQNVLCTNVKKDPIIRLAITNYNALDIHATDFKTYKV